MRIEIDGRDFDGAAGVYAMLARKLRFPDYFGNNLDALYDCLTEHGDEIAFRVRNLRHLGEFGRGLRAVLTDASACCPNITVKRLWIKREK